MSFAGDDKRLDHWIALEQVGAKVEGGPIPGPSRHTGRPLDFTSPTAKRRKGGKVLTTPSRDSALLDPTTHAPSSTAAVATPGSGANVNGHPLPPPDAGLASASEPSTPEREHAMITRVRNFEDVRFGEYLVKTWYYSPYPLSMEDPSSGAVPPVAPAPNGAFRGTANGDADPPSKKRKLEMLSFVPNGHVVAAGGSQSERDKEKKAGPRTISEMFAMSARPGSEGARGRLWVCDVSDLPSPDNARYLMSARADCSCASNTCAPVQAGIATR